jgi:hypothetical protein
MKPALGSEQVLHGADRAINSVSRKLDIALSVEYTVNELINAARDPANLARIFHGELLESGVSSNSIQPPRMEPPVLRLRTCNCVPYNMHP